MNINTESMRWGTGWVVLLALALVIGLGVPAAQGAINRQVLTDNDGVDTDGDGIVDNDYVNLHMAASDGFATMADGVSMYTFGFSDVTGVPNHMVMMAGMLACDSPGPTLVFKQGQRVIISLSNVGMMMRPDLFDPHTIHWHGFANAAPIFDGVPDASVSINMGSTFTYYYEPLDPGTYMWHCHVEATEHMQMGMVGQLAVLPIQNNLPDGTDLNGFTHHTGYKYCYNDGDGSTYYDRDFFLQTVGFDRNFHEQHLAVQPLPFSTMQDDYPLLNGRGYPDTLKPGPVLNENGYAAQKTDARIIALAGERVLLRLSSLSTTDYQTIRVLGIPMKVVGTGSRLLRGPTGQDTSYTTSAVTLGGGEAVDVILDTVGVAPGVYFLYTTFLNNLSNQEQDCGGIMTEVVLVGEDGMGESLRADSPADGSTLDFAGPPTFSWNYAGLRELNFTIDILPDTLGVAALSIPAGSGASYTLSPAEWQSLQDVMGSFWWQVRGTPAGPGLEIVSQANHVGGPLGLLAAVLPPAVSRVGMFAPPTYTYAYSGDALTKFTIQLSDNSLFAGNVLSAVANGKNAVTLSAKDWKKVKSWFAGIPNVADWTYYWRVVGTAADGTSLAIPAVSGGFQTGVIHLTAPADATAATLAAAPPVFSWTDSLFTPAPPAAKGGKYILQFSTSAAFAKKGTVSLPKKGTGDLSYQPTAKEWAGIGKTMGLNKTPGPVTVYWRVLAIDPDGMFELPSAETWTLLLSR